MKTLINPLEYCYQIKELVENIGEMPRKDSLVLHVSYDNETGAMDTVSNVLPTPNKGQLQTELEIYSYGSYRGRENLYTKQGPFDISNSSFLNPFGFYKLSNSTKSFTLSMFLRPSGSNPAPILSDAASIYQNKSRFSLFSNHRDIHFHVHNQNFDQWPPRTSELIKFENVLKEKKNYYHKILHRNVEERAFSFFAITYDSTKDELTVYDQSATIVGRVRGINIPSPENLEFEGGIFVGSAFENGTISTADTNYPSNNFSNSARLAYMAAISCLSYHNRVLTDVEIASLQCACQFKGKQHNQM